MCGRMLEFSETRGCLQILDEWDKRLSPNLGWVCCWVHHLLKDKFLDVFEWWSLHIIGDTISSRSLESSMRCSQLDPYKLTGLKAGWHFTVSWLPIRESWIDLTTSATFFKHSSMRRTAALQMYSRSEPSMGKRLSRVVPAHEGGMSQSIAETSRVMMLQWWKVFLLVVRSSVQSHLVVSLRRWILQWTSCWLLHFCLCHMRRIGALHRRCEKLPRPRCLLASRFAFGLRRSRYQLLWCIAGQLAVQ